MPPDRDESTEEKDSGLETKPFLSHLEDLRWTIIRCVGALMVGVVICAFAAPQILHLLFHPYAQTHQDPSKLVNIGVVDPFSIHMEISVLGGLMLSLPAILYFAGQFLLPALTEREKKFLGPIFAVGTGLFIFGVVFCYFFVLHITLSFFEAYSKYFGFESMWTVKALVDFEVQMLLGFGLAFELPLVIFVLNLLGIVSADQLASKRKHAFLIIFIAATCINPSTDLFSLSLLAGPMYVFYEICIFVARIVERRKQATPQED